MITLAADLGGTHARLALVELAGGRRVDLLARRTYASAEFADALTPIRRFIREVATSPDAVAVALAGPVRDGVGTMTNRGWELDEARLAGLTATGTALLLNDFEALGHALPLLSDGDVEKIQGGSEDAQGPVAILGAGTGLGTSYVVRPDGERVDVYPSEGGHCDFAPRTEAEWELRGFLAARHSHVSWERVLSADGLVAIYDFLVSTGKGAAEPPTRAAMRDDDPARVISRKGLDGTDTACAQALDVFVTAYGARAGDLALALGATGGIHLAGGIAPGILPSLRSRVFRDAFLSKGRMRPWLERVPVHVITNGSAGLIGAAAALAAGRRPGGPPSSRPEPGPPPHAAAPPGRVPAGPRAHERT